MTRRSDAILRWTARLFGDDAATRVFEPLMADWQHAYAVAPNATAKLSAFLQGLVALGMSVLTVAAHRSLSGPVDHGAIRRGAAYVCGFAALGAALLILPFAPWIGHRPHLFMLAMPSLLPSLAAFSMPFALVPGAMALAASTRSTTAFRHRAMAGLAAILTAVSLAALLGWIVPAANQSWRETLSARRSTSVTTKGLREMSMLELRTAALGSLAAQRDTWSDASAAQELLRRAAIVTTWPVALVCLGWRLGRHDSGTPAGRLIFWWVLPVSIHFGLQPTLHASASLDFMTFARTPELTAAAIWFAMALALRPRLGGEHAVA